MQKKTDYDIKKIESLLNKIDPVTGVYYTNSQVAARLGYIRSNMVAYLNANFNKKISVTRDDNENESRVLTFQPK